MKIINLALVLALSWPVSALAKSEFRADLKKSLASAACSDKAMTIKQLWSSGIIDTQMEFSKFRKKRRIPESELSQILAQKTKQNHHNGYAYGRCGKGIYWFASTPANHAALQKKDRITLSGTNIWKSCRALKVQHASWSGGRSRILLNQRISKKVKLIQVNTALLPAGTVSVTCVPLDKRIGDQLWYLIPTQKIKKAVNPYSKTSPVEWINQVRDDHFVSLVKPVQFVLGKVNKDVLHRKSEFENLKSQLAEKNFHLIGENRVIANNWSEARDLLWLSPSHRDLILNRGATHFSIQEKEMQSQISYLILALKKKK